jgi:CxxC-x17-CxxC domain-containing protein
MGRDTKGRTNFGQRGRESSFRGNNNTDNRNSPDRGGNREQGANRDNNYNRGNNNRDNWDNRGNNRNRENTGRGFNRFSNNRSRGNSSGSNNFRKMKGNYEVKCNSCGKMSLVPFKPTGEKPVFCSDCFRKRDDSKNNNTGSGLGISQEQFKQINIKLDLIISVLKDLEMYEEDGEEDGEEGGEAEDEEDEDEFEGEDLEDVKALDDEEEDDEDDDEDDDGDEEDEDDDKKLKK